MGCNCGKPKCDGKCGISPAVLQINNPSECTLFHRVEVPASMGDSKTNPPKNGAYKNVLLYYEADQTSWFYSSDGIPTKLVSGVQDYEVAINLPQINGETLIGDKTGEELGLQDRLTAGDNISIEGNTISAVDTTYGPATDSQIGLVKPGDGLSVSSNGTLMVIDHVFDTVADMKASTELKNGDYAQTLGFHTLNDGGGALYKITDSGTVDNLNTFAVGSLYATAVNNGVKKISLDELELVQSGVYTLGRVKVDSSVHLPRQINRGIIIVDTVFDINTPVVFPAYNDNSYFILPSFLGCTFNNLTNGRVLVTSGSNDTVASRITHCYFNKVDMVANSGYVQDFNFTGCYIASYQTFLDCQSSTVQVRMVNCTVESESKQLVNCDRVVGYFSGTYEGNINGDTYFIDATRGDITLDNAWLEGVKFLHLTGGANINEMSGINVLNSSLSGGTDSTPQILVDDGTWVQFYTAGTLWTSYNQGSRFCNLTPSQFNKCAGSFVYNQAEGYVKEMGGENLYNYALATEKYADDIEAKHFIYSSEKLLANTPNTLTLPCGTYLALMGKGAYSAVNKIHEYIISVSKTQNYAYATKIIGATDSYLDATTFVPSKANAGDSTFTLTITSTLAYTLEVNMIRIS